MVPTAFNVSGGAGVTTLPLTPAMCIRSSAKTTASVGDWTCETMPHGVDTLYTVQLPRPASAWSAWDLRIFVAKNSTTDGSVVFDCSSGSDVNNQIMSGEVVSGASPHDPKTWTVPAGAGNRYEFMFVTIATLQVFETAPDMINLVFGRLSNPATAGHDSYAGDIMFSSAVWSKAANP